MRHFKFKPLDLFYRSFVSFPWFYDNLTQLFSFGQWEKWQSRVFEDIKGKKILEMGVGPGKLLVELAKRGYDVKGTEISKGMAHEARKRTKAKGYNIEIHTCSVYHLPFENESFDSIVLTFVLGEIDHLDKAISEMKRVLKRGGKVIVVAGGMPQNPNLPAKFFLKAIDIQTSIFLDRDNKKHFEDQGFKVTRQDFGPFNMIHKIVADKT